MRPLRYFTAVAALAFFFTPLLLLTAGVRASAFENRELAARPRLSEGWAAFDSATHFLVDRLPLREHAVRFNTWKSINVFRTTPRYGRATNAMAEGEAAAPFAGGASTEEAAPVAPDTANQVLRGVDGWLYLQGDVDRACTPFLDWDSAVARWERLGRIVRESGRATVVVIAPDKTTIYPEHLPAGLAQRECMDTERGKLWSRLEASTEPSMLPLRRSLLAARDEFEHRLYFRTDSHWNSGGSAVLVREVLPRIGGRRIPGDAFVEGEEREHAGDLGTLLGTPATETEHVIEWEPSAAARRIGGRTLFVHDSFGNGPLGPLSAEVRSLETKLWASDTPEAIIASIVASDTIVFETVEREVTYRASALLTPAFLAQLERELATDRRG